RERGRENPGPFRLLSARSAGGGAAERGTDVAEHRRHLVAGELNCDERNQGDEDDQQGVLNHPGTAVLVLEVSGHLVPKSKHYSSFRKLFRRACGLTIGMMLDILSICRGPGGPFMD